MIVVDSSVLFDLLSGFDPTAALRRRVHREPLHAPTILDYEVVSTLRRFSRSRQLDARRVDVVLDLLDLLPIRRWSLSAQLRRRMFELRHDLTAYDAAYVALAEALECPLVTRDAHLARSQGHDAAIELH